MLLCGYAVEVKKLKKTGYLSVFSEKKSVWATWDKTNGTSYGTETEVVADSVIFHHFLV